MDGRGKLDPLGGGELERERSDRGRVVIPFDIKRASGHAPGRDADSQLAFVSGGLWIS